MDLAKLQHISRGGTRRLHPGGTAVIEYAQAMSATPSAVTDAMVAEPRTELGDAALIELTEMIAVENERSRINAALGLVAQGFSAGCQFPAL